MPETDTPTLTQYIATFPDGHQVMVDLWAYADRLEVSIAERSGRGDVWGPPADAERTDG